MEIVNLRAGEISATSGIYRAVTARERRICSRILAAPKARGPLPCRAVKESAVSRLVRRAILPADAFSGSSRLERRLRPGLAAPQDFFPDPRGRCSVTYGELRQNAHFPADLDGLFHINARDVGLFRTKQFKIP